MGALDPPVSSLNGASKRVTLLSGSSAKTIADASAGPGVVAMKVAGSARFASTSVSIVVF